MQQELQKCKEIASLSQPVHADGAVTVGWPCQQPLASACLLAARAGLLTILHVGLDRFVNPGPVPTSKSSFSFTRSPFLICSSRRSQSGR